MSKRKTISQRWYKWGETDPFWAYTALYCFLFAMIGLAIHLGMPGVFKTIGLSMLIICDCGLLFITAFRKIWWWFSFWCYVTFGVITWELASYFLGS